MSKEGKRKKYSSSSAPSIRRQRSNALSFMRAVLKGKKEEMQFVVAPKWPKNEQAATQVP